MDVLETYREERQVPAEEQSVLLAEPTSSIMIQSARAQLCCPLRRHLDTGPSHRL